jgi:hypothetical protein
MGKGSPGKKILNGKGSLFSKGGKGPEKGIERRVSVMPKGFHFFSDVWVNFSKKTRFFKKLKTRTFSHCYFHCSVKKSIFDPFFLQKNLLPFKMPKKTEKIKIKILMPIFSPCFISIKKNIFFL